MGNPNAFLNIPRQEAGYRPIHDRINDFSEVEQTLNTGERKLQASRCMDCGVPFCHWACPLGNRPPEFQDALYKGKWQKAYTILSQTNDFPEFTGRVCPALCEKSCVLKLSIDAPVTIREDEAAIIEAAFREGYVKPQTYKRNGKKVAVIGAGHMGGVIKTIGQLEKGEISDDTSEIASVPEKKKGSKAIPYIVPTLIVLLVVIGILLNGWDQGLLMFLYWMIACAGCTLLASIIALAHPLNALLSALTAPFFALNPVLGVGMFSGIFEATFRKPKVGDFEKMTDDAGTLKGWYRNRILHALVVFFLSSIGSMIGTFVAFPMLIANL